MASIGGSEMTDTVVHAAARFVQGKSTDAKATAVDALRRIGRIELADRALLALRLGEIAARIGPDQPRAIAKAWFDRAWEGDRWAKRKRYICFPGERAPDPFDEGAYAASGADWAALIEQAAKALHPTDGSISEKERARISRDILRGTALLPALPSVSLTAESAQQLVIALARKVADKIETETDLCRLWDVLRETPFKIESYDLERREPVTYSDIGVLDSLTALSRYDGDTYSRGPLGEASKRAEEASAFRCRQWPGTAYRFVRSASDKEEHWSYPIFFLGLIGVGRMARMFVFPQNFTDDLPPNEDELHPSDRVLDWLLLKGLTAGKSHEPLPEIAFDTVLGYGWRPFPYELARSLWLEVRPKADGSPGLWLTANEEEMAHYYPRIPGLDALALQAVSGDALEDFVGFGPCYHNDFLYKFVEWPTNKSVLMVNGQLPAGAASGLVNIRYEALPDIEGWIDDPENAELQDFLLRNANDVRFCPAFPISDVPPPGQLGTVAAALILNADCDANERLAWRLVDQARTLSKAGLAFYDALLGYHHDVIKKMLGD